MHVPADVDGLQGLGQTYSDQPSFLVWAWRKITGYTEALPVTPRYEVLTKPAAPVTPEAMRHWTPEMMFEAQAQKLGVVGSYEDYLREVSRLGIPVEPAAPGQEAVIPVSGEFPWTVMLIAAAVVGVLIAVKRR